MKQSARKIYCVTLTEQEEGTLEQLIRRGHRSARIITRARVLLLANEGKTDKEIYQSLSLADSTPGDIRQRFVQRGMHRALNDLPRPGKERILTGVQEAEVVAIACSDAPKGYSRWTMNLLTEEVVKRLKVAIGRTAVYRVLLRNNAKPWLKKNVVYSQSNT